MISLYILILLRVGEKLYFLLELETIWLIGKVYEVSCLKRLYEVISDRRSGDFKLPSYKNFAVGINYTNMYMLVFVQTVLGLTKSTKKYLLHLWNQA
jgi:hypothetical protein